MHDFEQQHGRAPYQAPTGGKAQTVYPIDGRGFPPASFLRLGDALVHCRQMADRNVCGVGMCPARSFATHWRIKP